MSPTDEPYQPGAADGPGEPDATEAPDEPGEPDGPGHTAEAGSAHPRAAPTGPGRPGQAVVAVHAAAVAPATGFAKPDRAVVRLEVDRGVDGDRHAGRPLRQVHLVDVARYDLLRAGGWQVDPGYLGENVTTTGLDLLALTTGAVLRLGGTAEVLLTGVRHPRHDHPATDPDALTLDDDGVPVGRVGVFGVVTAEGEVRAGDPVVVLAAGDGGPLQPL